MLIEVNGSRKKLRWKIVSLAYMRELISRPASTTYACAYEVELYLKYTLLPASHLWCGGLQPFRIRACSHMSRSDIWPGGDGRRVSICKKTGRETEDWEGPEETLIASP